MSYESLDTGYEIITTTIIVDRHNKTWEEQRSDHDITWEARQEYDNERDRAIAMFEDLQKIRRAITPEEGPPAIKVLEAIDMGVFLFEDREARIYVQPTRTINPATGFPLYDLDVHALPPETDPSDEIPYLRPNSPSHIDRLSLNVGLSPLKTTLKNAQEFNIYLDQVAARAGVTSQ